MSGFVLDAYAARSCPVKTQNAFLEGLSQPEQVLDESLQELFNGGINYEAQILADVLAGFEGRIIDFRALRGQPFQVQVDAATAAMRDGVDVIVGGVLPLDAPGHRSGRADLWLRGPDTDAGLPGYHPAEVKFHKVLERVMPGPNRPAQMASRVGAPLLSSALELPDHGFRVASREYDLLQLAHYWRLLEAAGFAAGGEPWAAIIGTDQVADLENARVVSWVRLDVKTIRTFSRTSQRGWTQRSPLERYDHEHTFRVKVAETAMRQSGAPGDPPLMVQPIRIRECDRCPWWEVCRPRMHEDDVSVRIEKSPLDVREIAVLRRFGVETLADLAATDVEGFLETYLPEVTHRVGAAERLRLAAHRARLMVSGVALERVTSGPITFPAADIEVDFDIETAADDRVYLWGYLVTDTRSDAPPTYVDFSDFTDLSATSERTLAAAAMRWLRGLQEANPGASVRVFHYSDYERVRLARLAAGTGDTDLAWGVAFARDHFSDLFALVRQHFFGTYGLGLKQVAASGAGFGWRDEDPGGLNSQRWFDDAVHAESDAARDEARQRVLDYNEDDVRATWALRAWLRSLA